MSPSFPSSGRERDLDEAPATTFSASGPTGMTTSAIKTPTAMHADADEIQETVVEVFRVVHREQSAQPFSSSGNRSGGRWTSPGVPAVYASMSPAGAVLEFLAHLDGEKPLDLVLVKARMPGRNVVTATSLPAQWRALPYRDEVREYGNAWINAGEALALSLPSVLCEQARNLLINPEHRNIAQWMIDDTAPFTLDKRLVRG